MGSELGRPSPSVRLRLYSRTARRARSKYGFRPTEIFGTLNPRPVFVVGCPRSGTTFTASALGRVPGFSDLGELGRLKAAIPELYEAVDAGRSAAVARELRTIVRTSQRSAMASRRRGIEQTPETTFLIPELSEAFPQAHFIHLVRDGRDVVSSLMEQGWLAGEHGRLVAARAGETVDEAGHPFGGYARFWVERGREHEFEISREARRCAWAWRRYVATALDALDALPSAQVTTIRYEDLATHPDTVAARLAHELGEQQATTDFQRALAGSHPRSVGRFADRLTGDDLSATDAEAGELLSALGYAAGKTSER